MQRSLCRWLVGFAALIFVSCAENAPIAAVSSNPISAPVGLPEANVATPSAASNLPVLRAWVGFYRNALCVLRLHGERLESSGYVADVSLALVESPEKDDGLRIRQVRAGEEQTFDWRSESEEEFLTISLWREGDKLDAPESASAKWRHKNHFHRLTCERLREVDAAEFSSY